MQKLILILLFSVFLGDPTYAASDNNEHLYVSIKSVFTDHKTDADIKSLISKGEWNKNKTAFALSGNIGTTAFIYAFIKGNDDKFTPIKLWELKSNKQIGKLGRSLDYYDHYEITPSIYDAMYKERKFSISYRLRAWKNGQRYTVHFKPVYIRYDGTLDWSDY